MYASQFGRVKVVRALLAAGADKHIISRSGGTAHSLASHIPASTVAIRERDGDGLF